MTSAPAVVPFPVRFRPAQAIKSAIRCLPLVSAAFDRRLRRANVLMLHFGRCGSTVIGNMLRQNAELIWDSEILQYRKHNLLPECVLTRDPETLIRLRSLRAGSRNYGFEIKPLPFMHLSPQQLNMSLEQFLDYVRRMKVSHLILVSRRHYLRQLLSLTVAVERDLYERSPGEGQKSAAVEIDCAHNAFSGASMLELFHCYDVTTEQIRAFGSSESGMRFLELEYSQDIMPSPTAAYHRVCRFLEIPATEAGIRNERVNSSPLNCLISNFDAVRDALHGTEYAWMTESDEAGRV